MGIVQRFRDEFLPAIAHSYNAEDEAEYITPLLDHIARLERVMQVIHPKNKVKPEEGQLRVWHIPQVPGKMFEVDVATPEEAYDVLNILAEYDLFQYRNNIKPDYSNASGLNVYRDGEWETWYDPETGEELDEYVERKREETSDV